MFASGSRRPFFDFSTIDFYRCRTFGAHEMVVVCGSARPIDLFASARDGIR
jgi:hypothetical protein